MLEKYCSEVFIPHDVSNCPAVIELILSKRNELLGRNVDTGIPLLRILRALVSHSSSKGVQLGDIGSVIFNLGYKKKLYKVEAAHVHNLVRLHFKQSFTAVENFIDDIVQEELISILDSDVIHELLLYVCSEKHRTEPDEIKRRIEKVVKYMTSANLPLTVEQENMMKHYHLLDTFLLSLS
jgi:hypothetical protein